MIKRLHNHDTLAGGLKALGGVKGYLHSHARLPKILIDLVFLRVSQINGCAFCIDMHSRDLIRQGMTVEKLLLVPVWHEINALFDARERAALAWAESVTSVGETHVPDEDYAAAASVFQEQDLADLTLAIALMNAYNRLCVTFRLQPGTLAAA